MATGVKPIRSEADYEAAMGEVASLWGAPGSRYAATGLMCSPR